MNARTSLHFEEHCKECGGLFKIDELVRETDKFRIHLVIENTGEHGTLQLRFEDATLFLFNELEAQRWVEGWPWIQAVGFRPHMLPLEELSEPYVHLHPSPGSDLPVSAADGLRVVNPGETWDGWFESVRRPLPESTVAFICHFWPFWHQHEPRPMFYHSTTPNMPFISLGPVVRVPMTSPLMKIRARTWNAWLGLKSLFWPSSFRVFLAGLAALAVWRWLSS